LRGVRTSEARPDGLDGLPWDHMEGLRAARTLFNNDGGPLLQGGAVAQAAWLEHRGGSWLLDPRHTLVGFLVYVEGLAERGDPRAEAMARSLLAERPVEAHALLARWLLARHRRGEAGVELAQALIGYRT